VLFVVSVVAVPARSGSGQPPARVTSSSGDRVVFRVDLEPWTLAASPALEGTDRLSVPRFIRRGNPGEPARPARKFLVGLPLDGTWTLSWRVLESASLGRVRLEPAPFPTVRRDADLGAVAGQRFAVEPEIYDRFRSPPAVTSDGPVWIRRQRVLPVWVQPLSYDPVTGQAVLATSIEVTVAFAPAGRGSEWEVAPGQGVGRESAEWEDVFSRLLVNAGQSRAWRRPPVQRTQPVGRVDATLQAGQAFKLKVRETGIHRVTAESLIAAGFPPSQPLQNLHLFKRDYDEGTFSGDSTDVAYTVIEDPAGTAGVFDGQDALVFYGLRVRDDKTLGDPYELHSDHNVYWLSPAPGLSMIDRTLSPGFLTADTAGTWCPVTRRFNIDKTFREETPPEYVDYYYYNFGSETVVNFPFEMGEVRPGSLVSLAAELHGAVRNQLIALRTSLVNSQTHVLNSSVVVGSKSRVDYQQDVDGGWFEPGENTFRFVRSDVSGERVHTLLNWLEVSYQALYRATGNVLEFNTASLAGDTSLSITGLNRRDLWLFDVSDSLAPVNCVIDDGLFTNVGGSDVLTFRDAIGSRKQYVLLPQSGMNTIQPDDIVADKPSFIIGDPAESGVDVLVVSHGDFVDGMRDWVRYREAQGYRVLMADVEDVYDEFNGGVPHARGIDRFIRHFFEMGNAGYVVLVGDGSEDHKRVHADSGPDYVTTHSRTEFVGSGFNEDEVVNVDKYYVKLPGPGGVVDAYPDMVIGRIPVGDPDELQVVLNKVFRYEAPTASEFWRRRMIIIADDAYSGGIGEGQYKFESYETGFQDGQERSAQIIESAQPQSFEVVRFFLRDYTQHLHPNNESVPLYNTQIYVREQVTPLLMNELNQGATLVTIQAHMNRSLVTHEMLFTTMSASVPGNGGNKDHLRLNNRDKPFIIFGMGCHFSDYAIHREFSTTRRNENNPNGDSFAEQLLFRNREAAVGTYGSSGFEFLGQVNTYVDLLTGVWFYDGPYETLVNQTKGKWIFGQLMYLVELEAVDEGQSRPVDRYHILGDPLLRIDAGPPRFDVTVNGQPFQSGQNVSAGVDTIDVLARVSDENAIEKFELVLRDAEGNLEDVSDLLDTTRVGDPSIPKARTYDVRFRHAIRLAEYDIVLRALQAADATSGAYHMAAEFVLHVTSSLEVTVNGRVIADGDLVPARGDYRIDMGLPVYLPSSQIGVQIDGEDVTGLVFSHPSPQDTVSWVVRFSKTLEDGRHEMAITVGSGGFDLTLVVSSTPGLTNVINYPNPFVDGTHFVYTNEVEIEDGTIDVYTVSGKKIARLEIPPNARVPGQNSVYWDGRDRAGDEIANGVYLYVIRVKQAGHDSTVRGKLARMK
jgi:hypothetical protein